MKCIILCLCSNIERYKREKSLVKETWGKPVLDGEYDNLDLWFYTASDHDYIDITNHMIYVNSADTLYDTWEKTYKCFDILNKFFDYDYIFRTNTSTVINIQLLSKLLESDILNENICYSVDIVNPKKLTNHPDVNFPIGYSILFSKLIVNKLLYKYYTNKEFFDKGCNGTYYSDDLIIGLIINEINKESEISETIKYNIIRGGFYKYIPEKFYLYEYLLNEENLDINIFYKAISVRCKRNITNEVKTSIYTLNNIVDVSNMYNEKIDNNKLNDALEYIKTNLEDIYIRYI